MKKVIRVCGLVISLSAVLVLLYFLTLNYDKPIIFTEPILWIRIPEILLGYFSVVVIIKMILEELENENENNKSTNPIST